jgi:Ala-tRNA(Pro) deacylase
MSEKAIFEFLAKHQIEHKVFKHQPVFTVADKPILIDSGGITTLPGIKCKTLFLKNKKSGMFYLVAVSEEKRVDLRALSDLLKTGRFSFGSPEELLEHLKLLPGSVSPFALLHDQQKKIAFILDEDVLHAQAVNFHPMRNDMNITMSPELFLFCMEKMEHRPYIVRIPVQGSLNNPQI